MPDASGNGNRFIHRARRPQGNGQRFQQGGQRGKRGQGARRPFHHQGYGRGCKTQLAQTRRQRIPAPRFAQTLCQRLGIKIGKQIERQPRPFAQRPAEGINPATLQTAGRDDKFPPLSHPIVQTKRRALHGASEMPGHMRRPRHFKSHIGGLERGDLNPFRGQPRRPCPIGPKPRPARPAQGQHGHGGAQRFGATRMAKGQALWGKPLPPPTAPQFNPGSAKSRQPCPQQG